jgi:hypothetical protein
VSNIWVMESVHFNGYVSCIKPYLKRLAPIPFWPS